MSEPAPFDAATFLQGVPPAPGVYRMRDATGTILYVGKARNLKKRVGSYFTRSPSAGERIRRMVSQIADVEVTVTATEADALLLENTLIKQHSPYYNVLLRDDKSYPYLYVSTQQEYPSLAFVRGRRKSGRMFGPYSSVGALRDTMNLLQKLFRVRQCADSVFHNRTRPCLQYQIDRCTAPCVGYIKPEEYRADVEMTMRFLEGRNEEVMENMTARMDAASSAKNYEQAAAWRDRIAAVQQVCRHYHVGVSAHNFDVIAVACEGGAVCVEVASFREGLHHGTRSYFPRVEAALEPAEILRGFLGQYYLERKAPREILLNETIRDAEAMSEWLASKGGAQVQIQSAPRGRRRDQLDLAYANALQSLRTRLQTTAGIAAQLRELGEVLGLDGAPARLECFDVSHTGGEQAVASCVVFGTEGPQPDDYRRFNLEGFTPGDDYAAMRQALERRYKRIKAGEVPPPDVLFVDGGAGQVHVARAALAAVGIENVPIVGVAKGATRKPGCETLHAETLDEPLQLPPNNGALHIIQQLRDEAHRFAITGHRKRRAKRRTESVLEEIPGIGPRRRQDLLRHFGGWAGVRGASVRELGSVPGIGTELATAIHEHLHTQA